MPEDVLLESSPETMLAAISGNQSIALWSENKKKDFVGTFTQRTAAARYILEATAFSIARTAMRRKFISELHIKQVYGKGFYLDSSPDPSECFYFTRGYVLSDGGYRGAYVQAKAGAREVKDLYEIAEERAMLVIEELPPLQKAVEIIDAVTAEKIDRREALLEQGQKLTGELDDLNEAVNMEELDQKMTIGQFRKFIKDRDQKRRGLVDRLNEIGREGVLLEDAINKVLYKGLPGLSDAIVEAVQSHLDRAKALDEMTRRVGERVHFGDSAEAMRLLEVFEQDEAALPASIKSSIKNALAVLKLAKPERKQVRGRKVGSRGMRS